MAESPAEFPAAVLPFGRGRGSISMDEIGRLERERERVRKMVMIEGKDEYGCGERHGVVSVGYGREVL